MCNTKIKLFYMSKYTHINACLICKMNLVHRETEAEW